MFTELTDLDMAMKEQTAASEASIVVFTKPPMKVSGYRVAGTELVAQSMDMFSLEIDSEGHAPKLSHEAVLPMAATTPAISVSKDLKPSNTVDAIVVESVDVISTSAHNIITATGGDVNVSPNTGSCTTTTSTDEDELAPIMAPTPSSLEVSPEKESSPDQLHVLPPNSGLFANKPKRTTTTNTRYGALRRPGTAIDVLGSSLMFSSTFSDGNAHRLSSVSESSSSGSGKVSPTFSKISTGSSFTTRASSVSMTPKQAIALVQEMSTTMLGDTSFTTFIQEAQKRSFADKDYFTMRMISFGFIACVENENEKLTKEEQIQGGSDCVNAMLCAKLGGVSLADFLKEAGIRSDEVTDNDLWMAWKSLVNKTARKTKA
jgi:hypothetical protein